MRRLSNLLVLALLAASLVVASGRAAAQTYILEVQFGGPGTVAPSGVVEVPAGGSQTFTFTPDACNFVADVTVDDVSLGSGLTEYTFTNVQSDHVLYVSFGPHAQATTTTLDVRPVPGQCAVPDTLIALVPNADGGQVQFFNGATLLGIRTLTAGVASYVVAPGLMTGSYAFTANYLGTNCSAPSYSPIVVYDVADTGPTPVTLSLTSPHTATQHAFVSFGTTLWIDGALAGAQKGQVSFYDGGIFLGTFAMTNGHSSGTFQMNSLGVHVLTAGANLVQCPGTITSEPETLLVRELTSMTLTITPLLVDPGESVLMTAAVSPSYATGTIHFLDVTTHVEVGAASLVDGTASFTYVPLSGPSRMMQVRYDGDAQVAGCTSNQVLLEVGRPMQPVVDTNLWITNGPVYSAVADGSTIYIGGSFTQVGPRHGWPRGAA